jgi:hypothetical protein
MDMVYPSWREIASADKIANSRRFPNLPRRKLCVVSHIIPSVRVYQRTQRAPMDDQPGHERSELCWREEIHFEHSHRMWTDGTIPDLVYSELRD